MCPREVDSSEPVRTEPEIYHEGSESLKPVICWLCGAATEIRLAGARDQISGACFGVAWCQRCRLGHTVPRPVDLEPFYAGGYYGGRHGATDAIAQHRRIRMLRRATRGRPRGRLIDIGCGDGTFLRAARHDGWAVAGTEMSPVRTQWSGLRVERQLTDLADLAPVSVATLWHSLEHLDKPLELLLQLAGFMQPGAVVLVAVPNYAGLQARVGGKHWLHLDPPRHLSHFGPAALAKALRAAGFDPFLRWDQELEYDVMGWSQTVLTRLQPQAPPIFFNWASNRPLRTKPWRLVANVASGTVLSVFALPLVPVLARCGRGSTIVLAARRGPDRAVGQA